jgi:hypothetical protein
MIKIWHWVRFFKYNALYFRTLFNQIEFVKLRLSRIIIMDSRESMRRKEKKQKPVFNKQGFSIFDHLPEELQRDSLSFLVGDEIERSKDKSGFRADPPANGSFFCEYQKSFDLAAKEAAHNLSHRIKVNETLAFMQQNPGIFQALPLPIEITDPRGGHPIKRTSLMGVLVALDEFDVIEAKGEAKPCALIPTVFSWFNNTNDPRSCHIKKQLQQQLAETSAPRHELATKERNARYLQEIKTLINHVIECPDISNDNDDVPFADLLSLEFIQNFMKNAFKPEPNDTGELGVIWDYWQIYLEYIDLLKAHANNDHAEDKSRPNLGGLFSQKADVVDTAVYMAFMRRSQFCHLEVSAVGIGNISARPPVRFDCSKGEPDILTGIGTSHFFGFYGKKFPSARGAARRAAEAWRGALAGGLVDTLFHQVFCRTKTAAEATHQEPLSDNVETRRSPSATAARR